MTTHLTQTAHDEAGSADPTRWLRRVGPMLAVALLAGLTVRWWAFEHAGRIRYELNQQNAFYWGDRIVRGANPAPGAAAWGPLWRSYLTVYEANEAHPAPELHTLDYVPLRLLMAGVWVNCLNIAYGPVSQWRPEFARSFVAFSTVLELAGAAAMFALAARWLKRTGPSRSRGPTPRHWTRWEQAAAAAGLVWLNPAAIMDSHVWPHGEVWILPFYLLAVLAVLEGRCFAAGVMIGLGSMFKGQIMMVAPVLILWPMFDRRWRGAARVMLGMACGIGAIVWPWVSHGSMAWARAGFAAPVKFYDVLRKGRSLNLSTVLDHHFHLTLHQHLLDWNVLGIHLGLEVRTLLIGVYALLLICCSWGISRQARLPDRRLLASIAAPWAVMFFVLGQMDERYLVWAACFSAGAAAVGWCGLGAHLALSWTGAAMMLEFLLAAKPGVYPGVLNALTLLHPVTGLLTAGAVMVLLVESMPRINRQRQTPATPSYPRTSALPGRVRTGP